ncbi:MAG: hypothetical protein Q7S40_01390 [Opitutaceae bacterium]|nr:hypothetical protein [Opitutaceae bacterium]
MFDLDHEVARWRRAMAAGGVGDPAVLDELESHLRDHVTQQVRLGEDVEQAFKAGVERVGQASVLKREFLRADKMPRLAGLVAVLDDRRKSFWVAAILSALVSGAYYCRNALATPLYEGAALVQIMRRLPQSVDSRLNIPGNDIRSAEDLNSILRLLTSHRLRTSVAASLTPAEQKIVRRSATTRSISDETPPADEQLGALRVTSMRLSLAVRLSVVHADAEAAALIANRYVEQCRIALRDIADSKRIFFRVIDPAKPSHYPIAPNFPRILQSSIVLGLATLICLAAMAAALRKLVHMRVNIGPQARTS